MAAIAERPARFTRGLMVLFGLAGAALVLSIVAALMLWRAQSAEPSGTDLGRAPAPPFSLVDQEGQQVSLAQFRGQPVVLTFLYTHCPDVCPLIADQVRVAINQLGADGGKVAVLAVSTDPRHDDRASAVNFTQVHGLTGRMHYLLGSPDDLAPIWKGYYIGVGQGDPADSEVIHSEAVFVIDKAGNERTLFGVPFSANDLTSELRKLLKEN
jgi:protein SCO1/2